MKKIGQLTYHASHNYGSVLQAYALSRHLTLMGYDTEFINLRPQSQKNAYKIIMGKGIHRAFHYLLYFVLKRRYDHFERFITEVLPITDKEYAATSDLVHEAFDYDAFICGGDQIWNPVCQDFEPAYFLQFLNKDTQAKRIAYSPSLGKTEFEGKTLEDIASWLKDFDAISVREKKGVDILKKLTPKPVSLVCDPVLLLGKEEWRKLAVKPKYKKPYILVYFLENNHGSRDLIEYLKEKTGYDVVLLNEYLRDFVKPYHKAYGVSPEEFVGLFMNAGFVYTNSFHGTVFSTIFEKPFLTAIAKDQKNAQNNNDSRKIDYLNYIGLENRLYSSEKPDENDLLAIDYTIARNKIQEYRKQSIDYLIHALEE